MERCILDWEHLSMFPLWQFGSSDPEVFFTTEGRQESRLRRVFSERERMRGSVIRCSGSHQDFCGCHFATTVD